MRGTTHLTAGCATWIGISALAGPPHLAPLTVGTLLAGVGALAPDADQRPLIRWLTGGHRHATHSLLGMASAAAVTILISDFTVIAWWVPVAVLTGWCTHIVLDSMTKMGCPWLWPWQRRFWLLPRALRISTGGKRRRHPEMWQMRHGYPWGEWITSTVVLAGMVAACVWRSTR